MIEVTLGLLVGAAIAIVLAYMLLTYNAVATSRNAAVLEGEPKSPTLPDHYGEYYSNVILPTVLYDYTAFTTRHGISDYVPDLIAINKRVTSMF
jgi:hypothetical protein